MLLLIVSLLYVLCFVLFGGLVLFIAYHGWRVPNAPAAPLRHVFFLLVLSLVIWQVTYLSETYTVMPDVQLWLGRANFAAIAFTVYLAWGFVHAVADKPIETRLRWLCLAETVSLALLTLLTPLVDAAERLDAQSSRPISRYGILFPLYLLHVLGYLAATLTQAEAARREAKRPKKRKQLSLIAFGIYATGSAAVICNALLPYVFGEFRFCDAGTLAALFFALAVAYAVFVHGLFDLRIVIRKTLVYGILLAFVLGGYSSTAFLVTEYLTKGADRMTEFAVLLIAFSLDPLRRWLEKKVDRLIFANSKN